METLLVKKDGEVMKASFLRLFSRSDGIFAQIDLVPDPKITKGDVLAFHYVDKHGDQTLIATGAVYSIPKWTGCVATVFVGDLFRDSLKTILHPAGFRKGTSKEIAEYILAACDVDHFDIRQLPLATLPHFSFAHANGWTVLRMLLGAIERQTGCGRLCILPAVDGTLRIGAEEDIVETTPIAGGRAFPKAIVSGDGFFKFKFVPLLYGQIIGVNGINYKIRSAVSTLTARSKTTDVEVAVCHGLR